MIKYIINEGKHLHDWVDFLKIKTKVFMDAFGWRDYSQFHSLYKQQRINSDKLLKCIEVLGITEEQFFQGVPGKYINGNYLLKTDSNITYSHQGRALKKLADEYGYSLRQMALVFNVTHTTISEAYKKVFIGDDLLIKACIVFAVPSSYFGEVKIKVPH